MMAKMSLDALRRQALEDGDELVIDGRAFNAARERMPVVRRQAKPEPAPMPPAAPAPAPQPTTAEVVEAVKAVAESVVERGAAHVAAQSEMTARLAQAVGQAVANAMQNSMSQVVKRPPRWRLKVNYSDRGQIESIDMTAATD